MTLYVYIMSREKVVDVLMVLVVESFGIRTLTFNMKDGVRGAETR